MKGLPADVYRSACGTDCTAGGVSSRCTRVIVVDGALPELFEAREDCPALKLVWRLIGGGSYVHAEPLVRPEGAGPPMFGGNFA